MHDMAKPAALAALAANKQGKFWEYHDRLYAEKEITKKSLVAIAKDLKLDMATFNADRKSQSLIELVNRDMAEAGKLGVTGTPTIFINGRKLKQRSLQGFQDLIDQELGKTR